MKNKHHLWKDNNTLKVKELTERMINIKKKFGFETIIPCWRNSTNSCFFSIKIVGTSIIPQMNGVTMTHCVNVLGWKTFSYKRIN